MKQLLLAQMNTFDPTNNGITSEGAAALGGMLDWLVYILSFSLGAFGIWKAIRAAHGGAGAGKQMKAATPALVAAVGVVIFLGSGGSAMLSVIGALGGVVVTLVQAAWSMLPVS